MLQPYESEPLKALVHGAVAVLTAICAVYSGAAYRARSSNRRHLLINGVIYTAATVWEVEHVRHHWYAMSCHPRIPIAQCANDY